VEVGDIESCGEFRGCFWLVFGDRDEVLFSGFSGVQWCGDGSELRTMQDAVSDWVSLAVEESRA
jgi:hypothetical protein